MSPSEPRFERLRLVGEGATARVDLARLSEPFADLPAGTQVAVKSPREGAEAGPTVREAFRAEAEAADRARHPSLVRVLHRGEADGAPYLLLSFVPGRSLREILVEEGPLPEPLLRSVGAQLAGALAALHAAGLIHGDVKPENVRLDDESRAVLLDLGLAHRVQEADERPGGGSLPYLSPERARGEPASPAGDLFALGVVLFELACGIHPFGRAHEAPGPHPGEVVGHGTTSALLLRRSIELPGADRLLAAIAAARFVPPSHLYPQLSPFLDHLLGEVLRRAPGGRPDAAELQARLEEGESGEWWRTQVDPRTRRPSVPGPRPGQHLLPLIGRETELAELAASLARVRAVPDEGRPVGRVGAVWLVGPGGCGKWRLASEFAARARASEDPPIYLYARWTQAAEARPAGALLVLLHRWLRLPLGAEPGEHERRALEDLCGARSAATLLAAVAPEEARPDAAWDAVAVALADWLTALGRRRPVLLFIDDLHRAGAVTLEALSSLIDALHDAQILFLFGMREDAPAADPALERLREHLRRAHAAPATELVLGPLAPEDVLDLVNVLFDSAVPRMRLADVLWKRSAGNPGQITEILYDLLERGDARPVRTTPGGGRLELLIGPDELPLPRSLDGIIAERLAALEPDERRWLQRLAVVGGRIDPEFLVRTFPPTSRAEADQVLARLVRRGWLVPAADRYRFARPALREAVYRSLSEHRRRRLHQKAAAGFVPDAGREASPEEIFQRAFHLRAAREPEELLDLVLHLVRTRARRTSARRLLTIARWGLDALEELPARDERERQRLELLEVSADAADRLGRRDEQRKVLDYLADLELDLDRLPAEGSRLYLLHGRYAAGTGQFGLARGMLRNARELAHEAHDRELESQACRRLAQVQAQIGEFADARELATRALELAQGANQRAVALLALAHLDVLDDRLEEAIGVIERAGRELRGVRDVRPGVLAYANLLRGRLWRSAGRPERALRAVQRALRLAHRAGERGLEVEARARLGGLLVDLDRPSEAEAHLRDARLTADEIEDRRGQVLTGLFLGLLLWEEDDARAQAMIERSLDTAEEIGFYRAESFGLAILARVHGAAGETAAADAASARAVELVERHGAELADRIAILGTRILVLRSCARDGEAHLVLADLERRVRRGQRRIRDRALRADQRTYCERLLGAVLSPEGPVYPRTPTV